MKKTITIQLILLALSMTVQSFANAETAPSNGRLVVFADKKIGEFKTDKSIRDGTSANLNDLKLVQTDQKNIHACFIGSSDAIKPILNAMIANTNKDEANGALKLKTFSTDGAQSSIHIEIISGSKTSYLALQIDPC
jgi:hypothetical protein